MSGVEQLKFLTAMVSCAFAAGAVGGVVNFIMPVLFGMARLTTAVGVDIAPHFEKAELYSKVFWGGLWGLVFIFPLVRFVRYKLLAAALFGLLPSITMIFLVFPLKLHLGIGGIKLGLLTPAFVLLFNTVGWSIPGYYWFSFIGGSSEGGDYDDFAPNEYFVNPLLGS